MPPVLAGGGMAIREALAAGLLSSLQVHVAPLLLGGGAPLFGGEVPGAPRTLEIDRIERSPTGTAHLRYKL